MGSLLQWRVFFPHHSPPHTLHYVWGDVAIEHGIDWYKKLVRKLAYYPLVLFVCWLPAQINRIQNSLSDEDIFGLYMAQVIFSNLNGFLNVFVYGLNESLCAEIKAKLCGDPPQDVLQLQVAASQKTSSEDSSGGHPFKF